MNVPVIVLSAAAVMMGVELLRPGRRWPEPAGWWARAALLNGLQAGMVFLGGRLWEPWLRESRLWSADGLGVAGGALAGYLAVTFVYYWWHRWRHESAFLWRWLHQLHHSAQRIEVVTSFYKHPLEIASNGVLSSAILYLLVGVGPEAASYAVLLTGLAELFYHWNVRTPRWLGYIIQRPESHCYHHGRGIHAMNYADLPLWDMLFGTFHNPETWEAECGLGAQGEQRLGDLLLGADVSGPPRPRRRTLRGRCCCGAWRRCSATSRGCPDSRLSPGRAPHLPRPRCSAPCAATRPSRRRSASRCSRTAAGKPRPSWKPDASKAPTTGATSTARRWPTRR
jgi:sterol desaturase/sphingolipid hydroxylase (fatty acid hydroxylase superfamily)